MRRALAIFLVLALVAHLAPTQAAREPDAPARLAVALRAPHEGATFLGATVLAAREGVLVVTTRDATEFLSRAAHDGRVRYVEDDAPRAWLHLTPDDPRFPEQDALRQVRADIAWDTTTGDGDAAVCVVDTGIRATHQDLAPNFVRGADVRNGDEDPADDHGHGTHVAGIAAAALGNGVGIAGLGNVALYAVKAVGSDGRAFPSDVAAGIAWCVANAGPRVVINLSLGCTGCHSQVLEDAVVAAHAAGALVVASSGNGGCHDCVSFPANLSSATAVGCTTSARKPCALTSRGPELDLAAPGLDVLSTSHAADDAYVRFSGTSMSAPHVAGAAAILWSHDASLSNVALAARLRESAIDLGHAGPDDAVGCGELDVAALVEGAGAPCAAAPDAPCDSVPANDCRANATRADAEPFVIAQDTHGASEDAWERAHCDLGASVWFRLEPLADGVGSFSTTGSSFDTSMALFFELSDGTLELETCNDDAAPGTTASAFAAACEGGRTYWLAVGGALRAQGDLALSVSGCRLAPAEPDAPALLVQPDLHAARLTVAPRYDGGRPIERHEIEGAQGACAAGAPFSPLATLAAPADTFTHEGLAHGEAWCFRARSVNELGASPWTVVDGRAAIAPGAVTNVTAKQESVLRLRVAWSAASGDVAQYAVWRKAWPSDAFEEVARVGASQLFWQDMTRPPFLGVTYRVIALGPAGEGAPGESTCSGLPATCG